MQINTYFERYCIEVDNERGKKMLKIEDVKLLSSELVVSKIRSMQI